MKYIILPETVKYDKIKNIKEEEFINLQIKYRNYLCSILNKLIDFNIIDKELTGIVNLPIIEDREYNFYHLDSKLDSNYLYLRNNIHIENLTDEELDILKNDAMNEEFIKSTIERVLFEEGDYAIFGSFSKDFLAKSNSIVLELSFERIKLKGMEERIKSDDCIDFIKNYFENIKVFDIPISIIVYEGLPDIYKNNNMNNS